MTTHPVAGPAPLPATPSPGDARDTRRGARAVVAVMVMLLRVGLLAAAAAACFAVTRAVDPGASLLRSQMWMNVAIVVVDVVCLLTLSALLRREGSSLRALLATRRPGRDALVGLGLFVPLTLAFVVASYIGNLVAFQGPPPPSAGVGRVPLVLGIVSLVIMPATVAVAEEAVYRAYALPRLALFGRVGGAVVMALVFGSQHVFLSLSSPQNMLARFVTTFLAGLAFAALWYLTRGRVWSLVVAHWLLDALFLGVPVLALALAA